MQRTFNFQRYLNPWTLGILAVLAYLAIRDGAFTNPGEWFMAMALTLPGIVMSFPTPTWPGNWETTPPNSRAGSH